MKTVRLFIVALFLTVAASAQPNASSARDGSSPTVYMISVQETDTLIPCEWRARAARNRMAMMDAVDDYNQTHRTGFQQQLYAVHPNCQRFVRINQVARAPRTF